MIEIPLAQSADLLTPAELYVGLVVVAFIVGLTVSSFVRFVPRGSSAVVTRVNRRARTHGPGVVAAMPGVDQTTIVVTTPIRVEPLIARSETSDAVQVVVSSTAVVQVVDPEIAAVSGEDPAVGSSERLERAIRDAIADSTLRTLSEPGVPELRARASERAEATLQMIGVSLIRLDIEAVESRVTRQLMSWADQQSRSACGTRR